MTNAMNGNTGRDIGLNVIMNARDIRRQKSLLSPGILRYLDVTVLQHALGVSEHTDTVVVLIVVLLGNTAELLIACDSYRRGRDGTAARTSG